MSVVLWRAFEHEIRTGERKTSAAIGKRRVSSATLDGPTLEPNDDPTRADSSMLHLLIYLRQRKVIVGRVSTNIPCDIYIVYIPLDVWEYKICSELC
jgi:hypothetical protein